MAGDDACALKEISFEKKGWLSYLGRLHLSDTVAAPSSELFYVAIDPKYFGERDTIEIYGSITVYDEDHTPYELYCRDSDDPQTLTPQNNLLPLDMPAEYLVSTSWSHISFSLTDKALDSCIADKVVLNFDNLTDPNQYNKVRQLDHNPVCVTYAAFPVAVVAILEIMLIKTNDSAPPEALNLFGKITARCGNTYGNKYPGIVLLNTPSNQPIEAQFNEPIQLERDVVVVPAYSFLRIHLQLSQLDPHQQEGINCQADFLATHLHSQHREIVVQDFVVRFNVQWCHPYELKPETRQPFKPPKISADLQLPGGSRERFLRRQVYSLAEVYTVVIRHNTNSELKISGRMEVSDKMSCFSLFDRDELNPVIISGNEETIPIEVTKRCFYMSAYLSMGLELEDVENQVLIKGAIGWSDVSLEARMSWYDKRICSVICGLNGYAAVFYTIFSKAVQVEVRISFNYDGYPDVGYSLDGSVIARHNNGTYLTENDKAYQSVLFRGNSSDLKSGCTLPLLKSVVAVPIYGFLTLVVDLCARPLSPGLPLEHLKSDICFNLGSAVQHTIKSKNCSIEVSIECSDLDKLFSEELDLIFKEQPTKELECTEFSFD